MAKDTAKILDAPNVNGKVVRTITKQDGLIMSEEPLGCQRRVGMAWKQKLSLTQLSQVLGKTMSTVMSNPIRYVASSVDTGLAQTDLIARQS